MALSNVEVIRDHYAATNERDWERAMSHYAEDVVLVVHGEGIRTGTFAGREATGGWFGDFFSSFDRDGHFDIVQITELDDGRVALVADYQARGRASGVEVSGTVAWLYSFGGAKITRVEGNSPLNQMPPDEALELLQAQIGERWAMSRNVETIRTVFEVFNREGFEATVPFLTPDTVWYPFPEWLGDSEYHGPDGARRLVSEWTENFDDYQWEIDELIDAGDAVIVLAHHTGRSKSAGTPVRQRISAVYSDFDGEGRTAKAWFFLSWEEAREAAEALG